ncbi:aldo/keto reductase [Pseudaestuariivita atlantica]|uniref:Pyridoxal 4-dehydrogenase n=1 Tax=Pseudaestuariivita atlantica TaxID=1317121 RepID=A0A0L1JLQ5_9RHOB|nr:aldo/keto reductase [Pseudaestuariivita atlantica]KNG92681.1 pyridoxal 4-dehydrogenase [Pseudaestuariivita atlantica]
MTLPRNELTRSGLPISQLGLGCASLAGIFQPVADADARGTIDGALEAGISYFDTAPFYGHGLSERLTGDGLRGQDDIVLSTKVGRILRPGQTDDPGAWVTALPFTPEFNYTYDGVMRSFETSLQRLGLDRIDILYIHDIGSMTHGEELGPVLFETAMTGGYAALDRLRRSGVIAAFGLGVNEVAVCEDALDHGDWDVFLLAGRYTLLEQEPLHGLMQRCLTHKTDVVIGGPFNSGVLVGGDSFDYGAVPPHIAAKVEAMAVVCAAHDVPLPAAALQFPLAHPAVKSVIPGPRTPDELAQNIDWFLHPVPPALWDDLKSEGLIDADAPTQP